MHIYIYVLSSFLGMHAHVYIHIYIYTFEYSLLVYICIYFDLTEIYISILEFSSVKDSFSHIFDYTNIYQYTLLVHSYT